MRQHVPSMCQRFASEGATVVMETLDTAAQVDVFPWDSVKKLITQIQTHYFQPLSVCLNTAGITQDDFLLSLEEEQFDKVIQVNLKVGNKQANYAASKAGVEGLTRSAAKELNGVMKLNSTATEGSI